jgi:hypothetical protein
MPNLATVSPKGRIDVLIYRIAERAINAHLPEAAPKLLPFIEEALKHTFGTKGRLRSGPKKEKGYYVRSRRY